MPKKYFAKSFFTSLLKLKKKTYKTEDECLKEFYIKQQTANKQIRQSMELDIMQSYNTDVDSSVSSGHVIYNHPKKNPIKIASKPLLHCNSAANHK